MKRIITALILVLQSSGAIHASESALDGLRSAVPPSALETVAAPEVKAPAPSDLSYKFDRVRNDIRRLNSDTAWLRSDLNRLESTARRIAQTNTADPFFQGELQRKAWELSRYANTAQSIGMDLRGLLGQAQKDQGLNSAARAIETDANSLLSRAQFDIENSAQRLEWAVRGIKPQLAGNAQWQAMDISRAARDLAGKARDISGDARTLVSNTQP